MVSVGLPTDDRTSPILGRALKVYTVGRVCPINTVVSMPHTDHWHPTACILCSLNCGIEVQLGGDDGRQLVRIRGDKRHPESQGYLCQKAIRLNHYQNSRDRLLAPLRRRSDGSFEAVDWDTAIRGVSERLTSIRDTHGGASIFYFGGGGQGNHLPGVYAGATRRALGSIYKSNALAQEKTGEIWVNQQMFGAGRVHGDFERCEVGIFLGKNPWQSHGVPRARVTLREMARDPRRALVVIDVVRTETADLADYFLQVKPGTDAWLLLAMLGVLVHERLIDRDWIKTHTSGFDELLPTLRRVSVAEACARCGVPQDEVRQVVRRIASAASVSVVEDPGVQMNRHSTLVSYLQRLVWLLTGHFAKPGAHNIPTSLVPLAAGPARGPSRTPVAGAPVIAGLTPCNLIPEEILTDHPDRYRAMIVESGNPAHSLADSRRMREALAALDCLVVIDVAMTETARLADYVLPTTTQFEKAEATFFSHGFPRKTFFLRRPVLAPPPGPLPEPEIHARLVEAMGAMPKDVVTTLRAMLEQGGRAALAEAFAEVLRERPDARRVAPALLYRVLGPTLPAGVESAAALWSAAHVCARRIPESIRRAGIEGEGPALGEALFDAVLEGTSGMVFTEDAEDESWTRVATPNHRIRLVIPELQAALASVMEDAPPGPPEEFPFVLSAGERRSCTANTIYRDPDWRTPNASTTGALRVSPADAVRLGLQDGDPALLTTKQGAAEVRIAVSDRMQTGHIALPNGLGVDYPGPNTERVRHGVAPNELTSVEDRDWLAGTPWHKSVPARLEPRPRV